MGAGASSNNSETKVKKFRTPNDEEIVSSDSSRQKSLARKPKSADSIMARLRQRSGKGKSSGRSGSAAATTSTTIQNNSGRNRDGGASAKSTGSMDSGRGTLSRPDSGRTNNLASADNSALGSTAGSLSSAVHQRRARTLPPIQDEGTHLVYRAQPPVDTTRILESLREEGLLESSSKGISGCCYELPLDDLQPAKRDRLPPHLARLERQKAMDLTKAKLIERLDAAEQRRKNRDNDKQRRFKDRDENNLQVKLALLEIDRNCEQQKLDTLDRNLTTAAGRRQSAKRSIVTRQHSRQEHSLKVQERKLELSSTSKEIADIMHC